MGRIVETDGDGFVDCGYSVFWEMVWTTICFLGYVFDFGLCWDVSIVLSGIAHARYLRIGTLGKAFFGLS